MQSLFRHNSRSEQNVLVWAQSKLANLCRLNLGVRVYTVRNIKDLLISVFVMLLHGPAHDGSNCREVKRSKVAQAEICSRQFPPFRSPPIQTMTLKHCFNPAYAQGQRKGR